MKSKEVYPHPILFLKFSNLGLLKLGISLKNISGSYISFLSYCIIQKKNGNHLFILGDKEQALYFFNDLENLFDNERGVTLLFYPCFLQTAISNYGF